MKTKIIPFLILCLILTGNVLYAQTRVIERPAFDAWNTSTLEFDKIEINDTATILSIAAFYRPKNWIRIDKETYIRESGTTNKLMIKGAEGIDLGKEFWMPESGEASFKLIFPPVGKNVKKIDFMESDCDDCFKIWGLYLEQGKKPDPVVLPAIAVESVVKKADNASLPGPAIKSGTAILSGQLLSNNLPKEIIANPFQISLLNPITKNRQEYQVKIQDDGSFKTEIEVVCPTIAMCSGLVQSVILIPGEESRVFVDLQKKYQQQSRYQRDTLDYSPSVYMINSLNLSDVDLNYIYNIPYLYDRMKTITDIYNMDADAYKAYILNKLKDLTQQIDKEENLSIRGKQLAKQELKIYAFLGLFSYVQDSKLAYIVANKLSQRDMDNIPYKPEEPGLAYYSFLKEFSLNDPAWLYAQNYAYIVNMVRSQNVFNIPQVTGSMTEWKKQVINALKNNIGSDSGQIYDLMVSQEYSVQLEEMKLFSDAQKTEMNQLFANKAYVNELLAENNKLIKINEELKGKGGFVINETPAVSKEKMFETIIAKYKGKVVFVDFWATWCGPCLRAMKEAEPVKLAFEGKDVVFLYLTGTTSPMKKWQEMVPGIHGEHYRVSDEQWNFWYSDLGIEGVPTYYIFDKEGKQKQKSTGFMGTNKMKEWISENL